MIEYPYRTEVKGRKEEVLVEIGKHMVYDKQSLQARIESLKERGADTSAEEKALKLLEEVEL